MADRFIILKEYFKNYKVNKPNKQPIIIIIYNENKTFFINDKQKVCALNSYDILKSKDRKKKIIIFNFFSILV